MLVENIPQYIYKVSSLKLLPPETCTIMIMNQEGCRRRDRAGGCSRRLHGSTVVSCTAGE